MRASVYFKCLIVFLVACPFSYAMDPNVLRSVYSATSQDVVAVQSDRRTTVAPLAPAQLSTAHSTDFLSGPTAVIRAGVAQYGAQFGIQDVGSELVHRGTFQDGLGMTHSFYSQQVQGIPVYGASFHAHQSGAELSSINARVLRNARIDTTPAMDARQTANLALRLANGANAFDQVACNGPVCGRLQADLQEYASNVAYTSTDLPELTVYNSAFVQGKPQDQAENRLAWKIRILAENEPLAPSPMLIIDAKNGALLDYDTGVQALERKIFDCSHDDQTFLPGCWAQLYSINTYSPTDCPHCDPAGHYWFGRREEAPIRGYNPIRETPGGVASVFGSTGVDDLYDAAAEIHTYYDSAFGRNGPNGRGGTGGNGSSTDPFTITKALANVNFSATPPPFCDPAGAYVFFGASNQATYCAFSPSTDVIGHENQHFIAYYKNIFPNGTHASLAYSGQAGALNEGHSDIFGEFFEHRQVGSADWIAGTNSNFVNLRNLANPPAVTSQFGTPYPDRFHDPNVYCGGSDNGGVHVNSSVVNKAGYLAVNGDFFNGWSIEGIGVAAMEQIMYRAITVYYADSETFNGAYNGLRQAARDLFGDGSFEVSQLTKALRAVEMDQPGTCSGLPLQRWGDFDHDSSYELSDIDALVAAIAAGSGDPAFDLTGDGTVDLADLATWRGLAGHFTIGAGLEYLPADANLDGVVDGSDFGIWNSSKFSSIAAWSAGDFNADGVVDGSDFGIWNSNKFTSSDSLGTVPEPVAGISLFLASLALASRLRREPPQGNARFFDRAAFAKWLVVTIACIASIASHADAIPISIAGDPGFVGDPIGDSHPYPGIGTSDLTGASVVKLGDQLRFKIAIAGNIATTNFIHVFSFPLDTDLNTTTGFPGIDSGNSDAQFMGTDFFVSFHPSGGSVSRANFTQSGTFPVTLYDNGYEAFVPLSILGFDDGLVRYKAVTYRSLGSGGNTGLLDYLTDVGRPPPLSVVPEPASPLAVAILSAILVTRVRRNRDA